MQGIDVPHAAPRRQLAAAARGSAAIMPPPMAAVATDRAPASL